MRWLQWGRWLGSAGHFSSSVLSVLAHMLCLSLAELIWNQSSSLFHFKCRRKKVPS